jgi:hypothetical protein
VIIPHAPFLTLLPATSNENQRTFEFLITAFVMLPVRAVATFVSLTAIACSILALSWVGLALLGF